MHHDHAEGLRVFNLTALDESRGEKYHGQVTHERGRAPGSTSQTLKQSTRKTDSLDGLKEFRKVYGPEAKGVIRFEWRNYKRLLQPAGPKQWRPRKLTSAQFFAKMYREDEDAELNWSSIAFRQPAERPVVTEESNDKQKLFDEYVLSQVAPGTNYSIKAPVPRVQEDGQTTLQPGEVFFKLINAVHGNSRPHIMPTVESADDIQLIAPVAFEVLMQTRVDASAGDVGVGVRLVCTDSEPQWLRPWDISCF